MVDKRQMGRSSDDRPSVILFSSTLALEMQVDEEQPLLRTTSKDLAYEVVEDDGVVEGFDPQGDDENPREWTAAYKRGIVLLLACMAFTVTFTCISVVPLAGNIVKDLDRGASNPSASALLVTIWELGEAAGPLLIAPMSEVLGRYPVMNGCNMLFIIATIAAAFCRSTNALIGMRALTGLAVTSNVLNPAIIGDMFESDQRGSAMSLVMFAPLIGGAIGPAVGGVIAQTLGWRSVLYIAAGLAIICEILFLTCFRETFALSILKRRAKRLHLDPGKLPLEEDGAHPGLKKLWHSITRPFSVLFGSPVLMLLSLFGSVQFSYFYVMSITMSDILQNRYGFSPAMTGTSFISFSIGSFVGVSICNVALDRIYIKLRGDNKTGRPEYRLPLAIIGAFAVPFAVILYGWAAHLQLPWPIFLTSVGILGATLLLTMIPLSAYVVDACGLFSASAMTGVIVTRCLMGTFLPLIVTPLARRLGYGWGFTCLGAFCLALAPIPVLIMKFGHRWRQSSEYTRDT